MSALGGPIPSPELAPNFTIPSVGAPSPWEYPNIWDTFFANGVPWQGKIRIRGARRSFKWDVKNAPGTEGWNQTYRGKPHHPFEIDFFMWSDSMYSFWLSTFQIMFQYIGVIGVVPPVKVFHPVLANLQITAIVADYIGGIEQVSDDLLFKCTMGVHEFYPALLTNATTTPVAAIGANPKAPGVIPPSAAITAAAQAQAQARQAAVLGAALPF